VSLLGAAADTAAMVALYPFLLLARSRKGG